MKTERVILLNIGGNFNKVKISHSVSFYLDRLSPWVGFIVTFKLYLKYFT